MLQSIYWNNGKIIIIDQSKLPKLLEYRVLNNINEVAEAIVNMRVRGAPLIGITAALGLAQVAFQNKHLSSDQILRKLREAAEVLRKTRPTAVNLFLAIDRILETAFSSQSPARAVISEALNMMREDIETNKKMAELGAALIEDGDIILTHCNTGALATVAIGTALGVIIKAYQEGKRIKVYATETRPKMQGSRLTMYELIRAGVDAYLIPDTAVAYTFMKKNITKVFVGAERILSDGTVYNKIGTLQIAIICRHFNGNFYTVAPSTTFDLKTRREDVIVEERPKYELLFIDGVQTAPIPSKVFNPAFDMTPPSYIDAIVTEKAVIYPPYIKNIANVLKNV